MKINNILNEKKRRYAIKKNNAMIFAILLIGIWFIGLTIMLIIQIKYTWFDKK